MKTAVTLPERVAHSAKDLAKRLHMPVSRLYRTAIEEYVSKHDKGDADKDPLTEALNAHYGTHKESEEEDKAICRVAAARVAQRLEWE